MKRFQFGFCLVVVLILATAFVAAPSLFAQPTAPKNVVIQSDDGSTVIVKGEPGSRGKAGARGPVGPAGKDGKDGKDAPEWVFYMALGAIALAVISLIGLMLSREALLARINSIVRCRNCHCHGGNVPWVIPPITINPTFSPDFFIRSGDDVQVSRSHHEFSGDYWEAGKPSSEKAGCNDKGGGCCKDKAAQ